MFNKSLSRKGFKPVCCHHFVDWFINRFDITVVPERQSVTVLADLLDLTGAATGHSVNH